MTVFPRAFPAMVDYNRIGEYRYWRTGLVRPL